VKPTTAAAYIRKLFPDEGELLRAEADLTAPWEELLGGLPAAWLEVGECRDEERGQRLLSQMREHFAQKGELRPAIALTRALVRRHGAARGEEHPDTLMELGALGALADRAGRSQEAAQLLERAYEGLRSAAGGRDLRLAVVAGNLAWHYLRVEKPLQAEQALEQAWRIRREVAPDTTGPVAAQLAELLVRRGQAEQALPYLEDAWQRYRDQVGTADKRTIARARTLAAILAALNRETEAIPLLRVILAAAVTERDDEKRAAVSFQLGNALEQVGQPEEAFRLVEEAVRWTRRNGDPHAELSARVSALSRMVLRRGRPQEAEGLLKDALEADQRIHGDGSAEVAIRYANLGYLCIQMSRAREAMGWLEPAASLLRSKLGDEHWQTRMAVEHLVELWVAEAKRAVTTRDSRYAREVLLRAKAMGEPVLGARHQLLQAIEAFRLV
jgi:tetratricopeptide (TPR) repeat protein